MVFCLGTEVQKVPYKEMGGSNVLSVKELKVPLVPCLEIGGSNVFLYRN